MASFNCFMFSIFKALTFSSLNVGLAARRLQQLPPLPTIPNLPRTGLPSIPTLPMPTIPNLPTTLSQDYLSLARYLRFLPFPVCLRPDTSWGKHGAVGSGPSHKQGAHGSSVQHEGSSVQHEDVHGSSVQHADVAATSVAVESSELRRSNRMRRAPAWSSDYA
ncbi:hypothetical protein PTKIN_Ptkin10aG0190400 [Pterospermum kingtungense]